MIKAGSYMANNLTASPVELKLAPGLLGGDATVLNDAYAVSGKPKLVGAPIVSSTGEVVALTARACPAGSAANCKPTPYAAPVAAIKQFLQRVPPSRGVSVVPNNSPAAKA